MFFSNKSAYFKVVRAEYSKTVEEKVNLIKQAEELKDSTDWKETTDKFIQLQKNWKTTGHLPRKQSDELWKRFSDACDKFFVQKNAATSGLHAEEKENLVKKKDIIARIKALDITNQLDTLKTLKEIIVEWNSVGYVPIRDKEKIYNEYRTAVNAQFDALNVDASARRLDAFRSNLEDMIDKGSSKLGEEHKKMLRAYERMKSELTTYENNLGFFTTSSKKGNGLIDQMNKKVDALKQECKLLENKIKLLEEKLR
jgi:SMC interacting uncharacterized protein involved in chromosome segregation